MYVYRVHTKHQVIIEMYKFNMFVTAVCVLFLIELRWPKNKSIWDWPVFVLGKRDLITGNGKKMSRCHFVTMTSRDITYFQGSRSVEKRLQTLFLRQFGACTAGTGVPVSLLPGYKMKFND